MTFDWFQYLEHSNRTICSPLSQYCHEIIPTFSPLYWGTNSYSIMRKGILTTTEMDDTEDFQCLRHSNWTICSHLKPSCPEIIPTFSPSYWEPILITPEVQLWENGEIFKPQNWMRQRWLSAWGIRTGTVAVLWAYFALKIFHLFSLSYWEPILITPEAH